MLDLDFVVRYTGITSEGETPLENLEEVMRWKLILEISKNKSDEMYYETREQMRQAKKFYSTMCNPPLVSVKSVDLGI